MNCNQGDIIYAEVHGNPTTPFRNNVSQVVQIRVSNGVASEFYARHKVCLGTIIGIPETFEHDADTCWVELEFIVRFTPDCIVYNKSTNEYRADSTYYEIVTRGIRQLASKRFPRKGKLIG